MTYVDQNGLVSINEVEATNDIAKLKSIIELLNETLEYLREIDNLNSAAKGDTNVTVDYATNEFTKQINNQIVETKNLIESINGVIEKYKAIDAKTKNQINSSMN